MKSLALAKEVINASLAGRLLSASRSRLASRLRGFLRLIRPVNSTMVGLAVVIGMLIASRGLLRVLTLDVVLPGFITGFTLSAAAMSINDYYDRDVDLINDPSRPIPSGVVKPVEALMVTVALCALGLAASLSLNVYCLILASLALAASITYATVGKTFGLPGNAMVSFCVALPFIYGGLALGNLDPVLLVFALMAFLANMGREVVKGIVDVVGDAARGIKTIAAVYGRAVAAYLATLFYLLAVSLSALPWLMGAVSVYYLPLVAVSDAGFIATSIKLLKDPSREKARQAKQEALVWMLIGLLAFALGTNLT
ncbi:MAG: hypothetical protein DRJ97_03985 [Thermoprotei archaeon]|nr:MAG: hypothetical protein DRJ97_03985 [Thermoprotei archaeon]